jgi:hypothetical protein
VRPRRPADAFVRPLNFTVRSPMASAPAELRATAFSYALLGALSLGLGATLVSFTWSGSWRRLWYDLNYSEVATFGALAILLGALAGLSLRYLALGRTWRFVTFGASLLLALWNLGGALRLTLRHIEASFVPVWTLISTKWLLAVAFLVCSYSLWKHRASNNRWRGP